MLDHVNNMHVCGVAVAQYFESLQHRKVIYNISIKLLFYALQVEAEGSLVGKSETK